MGFAAALSMPVVAWLLVTIDAGLITRGITAVVLASVVLLMSGWRHECRNEWGLPWA